MKIVFDISLLLFGFLSYERGWAKRTSRRSVYEHLLAQYHSATERFEADPVIQNSLAKDRCELNLLYESQRGRPLRRIGLVLLIAGALMLYFYR